MICSRTYSFDETDDVLVEIIRLWHISAETRQLIIQANAIPMLYESVLSIDAMHGGCSFQLENSDLKELLRTFKRYGRVLYTRGHAARRQLKLIYRLLKAAVAALD